MRDPNGDTTLYTYGNRFRVNEGQLQRMEVSGSVDRTTTMYYAAPTDYPWPNPIGSSELIRTDSYLGTVHTPMDERVILQNGVNFTLSVTGFDSRARPTNETRSSTLTATLAPMSRTEETAYLDFPEIWVLGMVHTVTVGSDTINENEYHDATADLEWSKQFGTNQNTFTYHTDGTLEDHTDPRGNTTTYSDYKRGIPTLIEYADDTSESATVNDYGLITSIADEVNAVTSYEYDLVGRVTTITQPPNDTVTWNPTSIGYAKLTANEPAMPSMPAGTWKRSEIAGNFQRDTYYDALWRPILDREYDRTNPGGQGLQRFIRRGYDHAGRPAFVSYPETTGSLTTPTSGTSWSYDALGRLKTTSQSSELGTLSTTITYQTGHKKRVTDPLLRVTDFSFQAFDEPSEDRPVKIDQPEDAHTEIKRNIFGNATEIKRKNTSGGVSATRSYVYDAYQRLCKSIDPESGATVRDYYANGSLSWAAEGLAFPITTTCNREVPVGNRTIYTYDERNRPLSINYPSGTSDVGMTYWPDGALKTTTAEGATWTYTYNKRRLLKTESLAFDGQQFLFDWSYNENGARSQLMYPDDTIVAYQPNVFGEATQVGGYVSGIKYHPNRAIDTFTYGNGIVHTLTQNDRDLPRRSKDGSVVEYEYQYDVNSNVTNIVDLAQSGTETRTMTYDYLNRLTTVSAPGIWGSATYTYDQLDNMKTSQVGTRSYTHTIDGATNRLDQLNGPGLPTIDYDYDMRGNATLRGGQAFTYDYANRLQSATNVESYDYDGHGRRVLIQKASGEKTYQVYSRDGELLFGYEPPTGKEIKYIHLNGSLVARVDGTPGSALPAPNPITASPNPSPGTYTVYWGNVGAAEYRLEEKTGASWTEVYRGPNRNKLFENRPLGDYRYQARGCSIVNSPASCGAYTTTLLVEVEVGTTVLTVTPAQSVDGSYRASWDPVPGALYFHLWEKIGNGSWSAVTSAPQAITFKDFTGRGPGTYYYYVVACRTSALSSCSDDESNIDSVTVLPPPCAPPTGLATTEPVSYDGNYPLTWTAPSGGCAATYQVRERYAGVTTQYTAATTGWSTPAAKTKNGEYFYSIASCTTAGACGSPSAELKITVVRAVSGIPLISPSFMNTLQHYIIDWTGPEGTTGYKIRERELTCSPNEAVHESTNSILHLISREDGCSSDVSEFQYAVSACVGTYCSAYGATANARVVRDNFLNALQTTYIHTDALHSPVAETNATGAVTKRFRYEPYGAPTTGSYEQGPGYTGHVTDASTGLSYMQQRYYDPLGGRFLSVDPVPAYDKPVTNFNRYVYARNSPYKFTDPDGRDVTCDEISCTVESNSFVELVVGVGAVHIIYAGRLLSNAVDSMQQMSATPAPPGELVGEQDNGSRTQGGRHNSGPLATENGGTGNAESDFDRLTGGKSSPAPEDSKLPAGSQVGENGVIYRPGTSSAGPRIDIPANGDKPHETLHYPKPSPQQSIEGTEQ